jgi:hypothetical protein
MHFRELQRLTSDREPGVTYDAMHSERHKPVSNAMQVTDATQFQKPDYFSNDTKSLLSWSLIILANIAFCAIVLNSPKHPVYDEGWYLETLVLLKQYGLSVSFLQQLPGPAGPTFTLVFAIAHDLFNLQFPSLRLVNYLLLLASSFLLWHTLVLETSRGIASAPTISPALLAATYTIVPTVTVSAGLALTEMPAVFFISLFMLAFCWMMTNIKRSHISSFAAILSGAGLGAAILGRQNYLIILPCLLLGTPRSLGLPSRREIFLVAIIMTVTLIICGPVFVIWESLVPPQTARLEAGISVWNGVHSAGYAGIITGLLAPDIFRVLIDKKIYLAGILALSVIISAASGTSTVPMTSVLLKIADQQTINIIGFGFTFLVCLVGLMFLACMVDYLWRERLDPLIRFSGCVTIVGILSNMKIAHLFSSRYVFIFIPFLILALSKKMLLTWVYPIRIAIAGCINLASLVSYLG